MRKNIKNKNAITLISLVVTILILLILAGVTVQLIVGEEGILKKAKTAKMNTKLEEAKEKVEFAVVGSYGEEGKIEIDALTENLNQIEGIEGIKTINNLPTEVMVDGYQIKINKEGDVRVKGKSDNREDNPQWILVEEISSPNYPKPHPESCNIQYSKKFDKDVVGVKIDFDELFLEMDNLCRFDRISIYDENRDLIKVMCGRGKPTIILPGNYYELLFTSDYANSYRGFSARIYITESQALIDEEIKDQGKRGTGTSTYFDHIDENIEEVEINFDSYVNHMNINFYNTAYKETEGKKVIDKNINTSITFEVYDENNRLLYTASDFPCAAALKKDILLENVGNKMKIVYQRDSNTEITSNGVAYWTVDNS